MLNQIKKQITEYQQTEKKIPLWLKLLFTAFMAVLVPFYWKEYGPTNFIFFCDIALFLTLIAVWTEKPIYASMAAVGITVPQILWQIDFLGMLVNIPLTGMTEYMFDTSYTLVARGLSFFHFWLPILLIYLVYKLGYDRKAFKAWTVVAWVAILASFFFLPAPGDQLAFPTQPRNINYVYGMDSKTPQQWMPTYAWLALLLGGLPAVVYLPTHLVLNKIWGIKPSVDEVADNGRISLT